ncbi:MAG: dienelactone hydrolase family protein [Sphingomonadales bacterium]|nr:dienelactone hydrolase family protein [Sphingomonadales bacterium]
MSETVQIPSLDGGETIPAFMARPSGAAKAAVIVIPEIFGINPGIRARCERWAAAGFLAIAPDIFWRFAPGVELDPDVPEQFQQALGYFGQYDPNAGVYDIEATIKWLRATQGIAKVGCAGYCLGGRLAYMVAARTDIDASVGYYGVMIDTMLNEAHAIARPLMLHIPTADHFVGPDAQAAIHAELGKNPRVTLYDYQGLDHGFATESGNRRNEAGAEIADGRTMAFLDEHLA